MHPELLGALARQRTQERTAHMSHMPFRRPPAALVHWRPDRQRMLRRARRQLGSMLLDVGLHLMVAT